jgi:hypothetical protein
MSKFIKRMVVFMLFALLAYAALLFFWGNTLAGKYHKNLRYKQGLRGFMHTRLREADTTHKVNVLFLGSSHTYRGFDTRVFAKAGMRSFNLGSSNQTPLQTELLLQHYLDRFEPKLVIYEVFPDNFEMDGVESAVDIISNTANYGNALWHAFAVNHVMVYNTYVFAAMRKLFCKDLDFKEDSIVGLDTYVLGGYVERKLEGARQPEILPAQSLNWKMRAKQLKAFDRSLSYLKERGVPVLLVQAPVAKDFYGQYSNYSYTDSLFATKGTYVNFNYIDSLQYSDAEDFYDAHHLSASGVKKFNESLLNYIKKIPFNP